MVAAPVCSMVLAELGAEVIKIEPPSGDPARQFGPPFQGPDSALFLAVNRGKQSVVLDLKLPSARSALDRLLRRADVLVTNHPSATLARFGLTRKRLSRIAPRLIHMDISGFGDSGPYSDLPAVDINILGLSGLMMASGFAGQPPIRPAISLADITAGLFAALGVLVALDRRLQSGKAGRIDLSMLDTMLFLCQPLFSYVAAARHDPPRIGNRSPFGIVDCFRTKDGYVTVAAPTDRLFQRLCDAVGLPELLTGLPDATSRLSRQSELIMRLGEKIQEYETDAICVALRRRRVPAWPVLSLSEALRDPHNAARHSIEAVPHPAYGQLTQVSFPLRIDDDDSQPPLTPPLLGEHTELTLRSIGYSQSELDHIRSAAARDSNDA